MSRSSPAGGRLPQHAPRPLKLWPFLLVGASAFAIAKISLHPRMNLKRDEGGWTLRYDYAHPDASVPADKGPEFPSTNSTSWSGAVSNAAGQLKDTLTSAHGNSSASTSPSGYSITRNKLEDNTRWILDTGATSHMCTNRSLLHSYRELPWGQTTRGFSSANGGLAYLVGTGNVTLEAEVPANVDVPGQRGGEKRTERLTLTGVHFYPTKGVNILSWSQLKRSATANRWKLRLVEDDDSSLTVMAKEGGILGGRDKEKVLMRFRLQGGLFVLEQPRVSESGKQDG